MASGNLSQIAIVPLAYDDIPGAIESIQTAFADDPYKNWVFEQVTVRTINLCATSQKPLINYKVFQKPQLPIITVSLLMGR